jgi:hypothetical protein
MLKTRTRIITATRMEVTIIPIQMEVHTTIPAPVGRDKLRTLLRLLRGPAGRDKLHTLPRLLRGRVGRVSKGSTSVFENRRLL